MTAGAALTPLADEDWPDEIRDLLPGFAGRLNVYRVMAHHPPLLRAWQAFRNHVVVGTALGREGSEVVILRTGHRLDSAYEWAHHVARSRALGLGDDRIASLAGGLDGMTPEDAALCRAVDELIDGARLSDATYQAVQDRVGPAGLLDLMATVGHYSVLAYILNSLDTPLDADVKDELRKRPLPAVERPLR